MGPIEITPPSRTTLWLLLALAVIGVGWLGFSIFTWLVNFVVECS